MLITLITTITTTMDIIMEGGGRGKRNSFRDDLKPASSFSFLLQA